MNQKTEHDNMKAFQETYEKVARLVAACLENTDPSQTEALRAQVLDCYRQGAIRNEISKVLDSCEEFSKIIELSIVKDNESKYGSAEVMMIINAAGYRFISRIRERLDQYLKYSVVLDITEEHQETPEALKGMTPMIVTRISADYGVMRKACDEITKLNANQVH